jgi:hypothetical protein
VLCAEINGDVGYLFFLKGELVHASSLDLEGESAAAEILAWQAATLSWCERRWPRERTISKNLDDLLQARPVAPSVSVGVVQPPPPSAVDDEEEPPPQSRSRVGSPKPVVSPEPRLPSAGGVSRALLAGGFKNVVRVNAGGHVTEARGSHHHLKSIVHASLALGDLLGTALGLGPLLAAEASASDFHRLVARSNDGASAAEGPGGPALSLARAFLKL